MKSLERLPLKMTLGVIAAAGLGVGAAVAIAGSTELGGITTAPAFPSNSPVVVVSTVPGTSPYLTPDGVLTKWRFHSSSDASAGTVQLKLFTPTSTAHVYKVEAESSVKTLSASTAYEFKERIPVKQGFLLGLYPTGDAEVGITVPGTPGNQIGQFPGMDIPVGSTGIKTTEFENFRVNVAATVETDADGDGFGDDTQDLCPTDKNRQTACPAGQPDPKLPKLVLASSSAQNIIAQRGVVVSGTSDEGGTLAGVGTVSVPGASKSFKLKPASKTVKAGVKTKLKLGLSGKTLRKAKRALAKGKKVRAKVTITATGAGGKSLAVRTIKAKRPKSRH